MPHFSPLGLTFEDLADQGCHDLFAERPQGAVPQRVLQEVGHVVGLGLGRAATSTLGLARGGGDLGEHGLEAGAALGVEGPGDVARGGLQGGGRAGRRNGRPGLGHPAGQPPGPRATSKAGIGSSGAFLGKAGELSRSRKAHHGSTTEQQLGPHRHTRAELLPPRRPHLQVLHGFAAGVLLRVLDEGMVGGPHTLEEQVVAVKELAVLLQEGLAQSQRHPQQESDPPSRILNFPGPQELFHTRLLQPPPARPCLQQVHGDGQHAAQDVGQTIAQLVEEGLEELPRLGHSNHAGGASVVDAIVEVVDTAGVDNLLAGDVGAVDLADACAHKPRQQAAE